MKTTTLHAHDAFFVNFFAAPAQLQCEMTKFESGNGKAINFTLSVWTLTQSPLFSSYQINLPLSNWVTQNDRKKSLKGYEIFF